MAAGLFLALIFGDWGRYGVDQVLPFVIAAGLLLVTPLVRGLNDLLERVRHPSPRGATIGAVVVTVIAFVDPDRRSDRARVRVSSALAR